MELDRSICASLGICEARAPQLFEVNEQGDLDVLLDGRVSDEDLAVVRSAVAACPMEALTLHGD